MKRTMIAKLGVIAGAMALVTSISPFVTYASVNDIDYMGASVAGSWTGASASITRPNSPYVNINDPDALTSNWVAIEDNAASYSTAIDQVGYWQTGAYSPGVSTYFLEYGNDSGQFWIKYSTGGSIENAYGPEPSGAVGPAMSSTAHQYEIDYAPASGEITGWVDTSDFNGQFDITGFNQGWTPNAAVISSEIHNYADARWYGSQYEEANSSGVITSYGPTNFTSLRARDSSLNWTYPTWTAAKQEDTSSGQSPTAPDGGYSGILGANGTSSANFYDYDTRS